MYLAIIEGTDNIMNIVGVGVLGLLLFAYYFVMAIPVLGLLYLLFRFIRKYIKRKYKEAVQKESIAFAEVTSLNGSFVFYDILKTFNRTINCESKRQYDNFDFDSHFIIYSHENITELREAKLNAANNLLKYQDYCKQYDEIVNTIGKYDPNKSKRYLKTERDIVNEAKQSPVTSFEIVIRKYYKSPQGRNRYQEERKYTDQDFEDAEKSYKQQNEEELAHKAMIAKEREAMTPAMRYEVLRRDGFQCTICGATQKDGVKLHVDHIKPVAKGGKTEMSNLRTLCDRCNLGKSDSYYEDGLN